MRQWSAFLASVVVAASAGAAFADCRAVTGAQGLPDGTWLFRASDGWRPVPSAGELPAAGRSRTVSFAYVVREPESKALRRGILVIKTGVNAPPSGNGAVTLARANYRETAMAVDRCESYPRFTGGSVSARSYDDYHDYSYRVESPDSDTLRSFHVTYPTRVAGRCKRSDDAATDSYFAGRWQSNRSQFSFNPRVVESGQHSQLLALFTVAPAYASPSMSEQRVEIRRYVADGSGLACVLFDTVVKPGSFVRVNDLERGRVFRAAEQAWTWPR